MIEELNQLCKKYNFRYDEIGKYIRVFSKRDTWYFVNRDYRPYELIKLLHANNYGGAGIHAQKGGFNNLQQIFAYVDKHDKKELLRRDKTIRIAEKLKIIYAK